MKKLLVMLVVLAFSICIHAKESSVKIVDLKMIKSKVERITGGAKILGIEKSPIPGLYLVFIEKGNRRGALMISDNARYVITGNLIDVTDPQNPRSIVREIGIKKGYIKPPEGKRIDTSKLSFKDTPRFGKKGAPEIIVFFDPTCPFCKKELEDLKELADEGKISFYVKYFIVHGNVAKERAIKAECIRESLGNKAYWDYLLKNKEPSGSYKCNRKEIEKRIEQDQKEATALKLRGTPSWIYNGKLFEGYVEKETVIKIIDNNKNTKVK